MAGAASRAFKLALVLSLAYLAAAQKADTSSSEVFSTVDSNHDGVIDRTEFSTLEKNDKSGWLLTLAGKAKQLTTSFWKATYGSLSMIIATEIGDRTFCIAAVMAMRYARLTVFAGAIGALMVMTVLSTVIGVALPALLPKLYTHYAAAALFLYFGVRLLQEAASMPHGGGVSEELAETEQELGITVEKGESSSPVSGEVAEGAGGERSASLGEGASAPYVADDADSGAKSDLAKVRSRASAGPSSSGSSTSSPQGAESGPFESLAKEWPIFSQAFTLTFLAEWGDRSQIATIAMAAAQDPFGGT